jgi:hypothetical protein
MKDVVTVLLIAGGGVLLLILLNNMMSSPVNNNGTLNPVPVVTSINNKNSNNAKNMNSSAQGEAPFTDDMIKPNILGSGCGPNRDSVEPMPTEEPSNWENARFGSNDTTTSGCPVPQGQFLSSNLLPKDNSKVAEDWGQFAPKDLYGRNFLDATKYFGVDTVGQSLRNANQQLRSEPPNPLKRVSPWNQSTMLPDTMRRAFNLDDCSDCSYKEGLQPGEGWAKLDRPAFEEMSK